MFSNLWNRLKLAASKGWAKITSFFVIAGTATLITVSIGDKNEWVFTFVDAKGDTTKIEISDSLKYALFGYSIVEITKCDTTWDVVENEAFEKDPLNPEKEISHIVKDSGLILDNCVTYYDTVGDTASVKRIDSLISANPELAKTWFDSVFKANKKIERIACPKGNDTAFIIYTKSFGQTISAPMLINEKDNPVEDVISGIESKIGMSLKGLYYHKNANGRIAVSYFPNGDDLPKDFIWPEDDPSMGKELKSKSIEDIK